MNILVRNTNQNDVDAVYRLVCDLEKCTFPKYEFTELFNMNNSIETIGYFVAQLDDQIVGFGSIYINNLLHHCGKVGEIQELVISPECQLNNIGRLMVKEMIGWAVKQGAIQAEVTCNIARQGAYIFYKSIGFVHTHNKMVYSSV